MWATSGVSHGIRTHQARVRATLIRQVSRGRLRFCPMKSWSGVGEGGCFDTASFAQLPLELMETVSRRIINEVSGVSRVAYDISSKPPATIEWE